MKQFRILIAPQAPDSEAVTIRDRQALHHLLKVVRVKPGDWLECFDGQGGIYAGSITHCSASVLRMAVSIRRHEPQPNPRITLAQALIQGERFEWTLQKGTELGVAAFMPMITARTLVRPLGHRGEHRLVRWRRIVAEAVRQCGRAVIPSVQTPEPFEKVLKGLGGPGLLLTLAEEGTPLQDAWRALQGVPQALVMIGPEGDFTPEEVQEAKRYGASPVRLQSATLRSETAAVAVVAILQHALGRM